MLQYVPDDYVQAHPADDAVNVNCVVSWSAFVDDPRRVIVDLHNGWCFDSHRWNGRGDAAWIELECTTSG